MVKEIAVLHSRTGGKTLLVEKMISAYLKLNPEANVVRIVDDKVIVEKFVSELGLLQIEDK